MTKQITTKKTMTVAQRNNNRITLASSSIVALVGMSSLFIWGFSVLALLAAVGGVFFGAGSFVLNHIKTGAYLPAQTEKKLRQKLISMKFKLDDQFEDFIDQVIEAEKKIQKKRAFLEEILLKFFTPSEMTYIRYHNAGQSALDAIEADLNSIAEKLTTLENFENEANKDKIFFKTQEMFENVKSLFQSYESLIMSFEECEVPKQRDDIFMQLEDLAKRTKKYNNL